MSTRPSFLPRLRFRVRGLTRLREIGEVLLTIVVLTASSLRADAASTLPLDINQLVGGAKDIVHVRCATNFAQRDASVGAITVTTFVVLDQAKGIRDKTFTLRQAGGEIDGVKIDYHVPTFTVGDEYVLFVPPSSPLGLASPLGLGQGVFGVVSAPASASGKEVSNGRDFAELMNGGSLNAIPTGIARRIQLSATSRPKTLDLGDFMTLLRSNAGTR